MSRLPRSWALVLLTPKAREESHSGHLSQLFLRLPLFPWISQAGLCPEHRASSRALTLESGLCTQLSRNVQGVPAAPTAPWWPLAPATSAATACSTPAALSATAGRGDEGCVTLSWDISGRGLFFSGTDLGLVWVPLPF